MRQARSTSPSFADIINSKVHSAEYAVISLVGGCYTSCVIRVVNETALSTLLTTFVFHGFPCNCFFYERSIVNFVNSCRASEATFVTATEEGNSPILAVLFAKSSSKEKKRKKNNEQWSRC